MVGTYERYNRLQAYDQISLPGEKPFQTVVKWNKVSADGGDWAIVHAGGMVINGKKVALPDTPILPHAFQFLAGGRWVYVGDRRVVVGTEPGPQFDAIHSWVVHPHSGAVAYVASQDAEWAVVRNGRREPVLGIPDPRSLRISPDGERLAYVAEREGREVAVVDGKEVAFKGKTVLGRQIIFSPDWKRFAFVASDATTSTVVVDGRPDEPYPKITPDFLTFSPDGRQYAYAASADGRAKVVLNGQEVTGNSLTPAFTFSPDGRRFAYVAVDEGSECVVVDGKRGPAFDAVKLRNTEWGLDAGANLRLQVFESILFSPDSKRHAYCVKKGGGESVVVDGQVGPVYDVVMWARRLNHFSGDGRTFAYVARRAGKMFVVNNGREWGPYDDLSTSDFVVGHDGAHLAFVGFEPDPKDLKVSRERVLVDGVAGPWFRTIVRDTVVLSPCGQHHAYVAQLLDVPHLLAVIVDGKEVGRIESPSVFDAIGKMYDEQEPLPRVYQEPGLWFPVYDRSGVARYEELPGRWRSKPGLRVKRPEPHHFSLSDYRTGYRSHGRKLTVWGFRESCDLVRYDIEVSPQP